jgi:hypothetical protein
MSKEQNYILIFVAIIIIVGSFVLFKNFTIRSVNPDGMVATDDMSVIDQAELARNYQNALAEILPRYRAVLPGNNIADIPNVREELLALTVPAQYRDVHAKLVLLLDSLADGTPAETIRVSFTELASANEWLYNLAPDVQ